MEQIISQNIFIQVGILNLSLSPFPNPVSYTHLQKSGARPEKVKVELVRDDEQQLATLKFSQGATSASVSPDGKQIAFIVRGDVFVTSTDYATTKQITNTPVRRRRHMD